MPRRRAEPINQVAPAFHLDPPSKRQVQVEFAQVDCPGGLNKTRSYTEVRLKVFAAKPMQYNKILQVEFCHVIKRLPSLFLAA